MLIPTAEGIVKKTRPVGQRIAKPTSYLYTPPPPPDSRSMSILHDDTYPVSSYRAPSSSSYTPQKPYGEWEQQAAVPSVSEDLEVEAAPILIAAPSLASDATIDEAFVLKERSMDSSHFPGTLPPPCAPVQFKKRQVSNTPKNRSIRVKLEWILNFYSIEAIYSCPDDECVLPLSVFALSSDNLMSNKSHFVHSLTMWKSNQFLFQQWITDREVRAKYKRSLWIIPIKNHCTLRDGSKYHLF